jgi:hypothetical protein
VFGDVVDCLDACRHIVLKLTGVFEFPAKISHYFQNMFTTRWPCIYLYAMKSRYRVLFCWSCSHLSGLVWFVITVNVTSLLQVMLKAFGGGAVMGSSEALRQEPMEALVQAIVTARRVCRRRVVLVVDGLIVNEVVHFATEMTNYIRFRQVERGGEWYADTPLKRKVWCVLSTGPLGHDSTLCHIWADAKWFNRTWTPAALQASEKREDESLEDHAQRLVYMAAANMANRGGVNSLVVPQLDVDERRHILEAHMRCRGALPQNGSMHEDDGDMRALEAVCCNPGASSPLYLSIVGRKLSDTGLESVQAAANQLPRDLRGPAGICYDVFKKLEIDIGVYTMQKVALALVKENGCSEEDLYAKLLDAIEDQDDESMVVDAETELKMLMMHECEICVQARCVLRQPFWEDAMTLYVR